jgi:hypothetical protein
LIAQALMRSILSCANCRSAGRIRVTLLMTLSAACLGGVVAPGPALAATLDQQQGDALGLALSANSTQSLAQTFTAGLNGGIDQVDLHLGEISPASALSVEIRDVSGGLPGGTVLASTSVQATEVPPDIAAAFVPITFAAPAAVSAGTQYAIVASSSTGPGTAYDWRDGSTPNQYGGGVGFFAAPPSGGWNALGPDLAFKTYVGPLPTASPTASPTTSPTASPATPSGRRATALKKCKKKRSNRARKKCRKKANLLPV